VELGNSVGQRPFDVGHVGCQVKGTTSGLVLP
jgi:hypothetical protein